MIDMEEKINRKASSPTQHANELGPSTSSSHKPSQIKEVGKMGRKEKRRKF